MKKIVLCVLFWLCGCADEPSTLVRPQIVEVPVVEARRITLPVKPQDYFARVTEKDSMLEKVHALIAENEARRNYERVLEAANQP